MLFNSKSDKILFYKFPVILFSLIPLFLISGPFLSDLAVSLIGLVFLIYCVKYKNFSFFKNKFFYIFFIFWIYLLFNSLINNFNFDSFKISFFYFRFGIFVIAIVALLNFDFKFLKYFFFCILICFSALIVDGFLQYFTGENILGWKNVSRISSFFGDEKILGSYLSRLWPIFFGLSIYFLKEKNLLFYFFVLTFILSETLIFLSGERAAFFYINLSAIFIIIFSKNLLKLRLITLISSILILIIISFINPNAKERIIDKTFNDMNILNSQEKKDADKDADKVYMFSKIHNELYVSAYKIFLDNKILGVGVKNFRNSCSDPKYKTQYSCDSHPHNTFLQILSETGLIGFMFFLYVFYIFIKNILLHLIYKWNKKQIFNDFEICILSGIFIYLWPIVPTGNFFNNWLSIIMFLNLPLLIWSKKLYKA